MLEKGCASKGGEAKSNGNSAAESPAFGKENFPQTIFFSGHNSCSEENTEAFRKRAGDQQSFLN
jgi:hypothetical protein